MVFGNENDKGLVFEKGKLKVVKIGEGGYTLDDILVHDAKTADPTLHLALINMSLPEFPVAMGVVRSVDALVYDQEVARQIKDVQADRKISSVDELLRSGNTWEVNEPTSSDPVPFFHKKMC